MTDRHLSSIVRTRFVLAVFAAGLGLCGACATGNTRQLQTTSRSADALAAHFTETPTEGPMTTTSSSTPEAQRVVQAQLDAYNARDIDAFMATFHDRAELFKIGDPKPTASGHDEVRTIYGKLFADSPKLHSELVHRAVLGARVIDHERITGRQGGQVLEIVMVYEVEDGLIRRAWAIK